MAFKLGNKKGSPVRMGSREIVTTPLEMGTLAEARNDGTIAISPEVDQANRS